MSGHSKWATTKHKKAAADAKRGNLFTKLSKNISVAARAGADPNFNFSLRLSIDKAKEANMPKDKIELAIQRGAGGADGATIEEVLYEAFGPSGAALLIAGVTDNKNRTTSEIKTILGKNGGTFGAQNSVKWMFEHKGVVHLAPEQIKNNDELMLELLEIGADDVAEEEGGLTIYCGFVNFEKVKKQLEQKNLKLEYAEMEWVAKDKIPVNDDVRSQVERMVEILEEHDDVNSVYSNIA
ncbi:YebC/PmpR family DNA-binding transcriptional regulator [Candidatus Falkowbacteria bacterium]|nr:YebC/PmpR family DNA-binding transcriptional regulator [Candidatus Falkowbacteria bacterium]